MSTLVDRQIRKLATVHAAISPFRESQLNPASYNLTIGTKGFIESPLIGPARTADGLRSVDLTQGFTLPPGGWILTDVEELISIPSNIEAQVILRSSAARKGWDHALAGFVDPGYGLGNPSRLTLEFVNCLKYHSLHIQTGMEMVQIKFSLLAEVPDRGYDQTGRYHGAKSVEGCKDRTLDS